LKKQGKLALGERRNKKAIWEKKVWEWMAEEGLGVLLTEEVRRNPFRSQEKI